jgi:hypothetical protein
MNTTVFVTFWLIVLIQCHCIADNEDFGMAGHGQVALDFYSAGAIGFDSQPFAGR